MDTWQPMDTAPKDGTNVLLCFDGPEDYGVIEGYFLGGGWRVIGLSSHGCGCCGSDNQEPNWWMPIPELPKGE